MRVAPTLYRIADFAVFHPDEAADLGPTQPSSWLLK
jgi:hypothetical protein